LQNHGNAGVEGVLLAGGIAGIGSAGEAAHHSQTTMSDTEHCIKVCNSLLRGEISAVETYDKAIEKYRY
jgi:hypothetical protein